MEVSKLAGIFDELEKISATVLMKELTPAAKKFMNRLTGFSGVEKHAPPTARKLKKLLTGPGSPPLTTGISHSKSLTDKAVKEQSRKVFEDVLSKSGKVYKRGVPSKAEKILPKKVSTKVTEVMPISPSIVGKIPE